MELRKGLRLFVDTAPIIYFIEEHPAYIDEVSDIFNISYYLDRGPCQAI